MASKIIKEERVVRDCSTCKCNLQHFVMFEGKWYKTNQSDCAKGVEERFEPDNFCYVYEKADTKFLNWLNSVKQFDATALTAYLSENINNLANEFKQCIKHFSALLEQNQQMINQLKEKTDN